MDNLGDMSPQPGGDPVSSALVGLVKAILLITVLVIASGLVGIGFILAVLSNALA